MLDQKLPQCPLCSQFGLLVLVPQEGQEWPKEMHWHCNKCRRKIGDSIPFPTPEEFQKWLDNLPKIKRSDEAQGAAHPKGGRK
jgi:hypothetical protein